MFRHTKYNLGTILIIIIFQQTKTMIQVKTTKITLFLYKSGRIALNNEEKTQLWNFCIKFVEYHSLSFRPCMLFPQEYYFIKIKQEIIRPKTFFFILEFTIVYDTVRLSSQTKTCLYSNELIFLVLRPKNLYQLK